MDVVGIFMGKLKHKRVNLEEKVYVVRNASTSLLGLRSCEELGLVKRVEEVRTTSMTDVDAEEEFPELFQGLSKLHGDYDIKLKPNSKPYDAQVCRRDPLPLMDKLKSELEDMVKKDVIQSVKEATDWCAPIVLAKKSNGAIRLCVDLQKLNENVERDRHMLPVVEHELGKLSGSKFFSKLDANSGFWQGKLSEKSAN